MSSQSTNSGQGEKRPGTPMVGFSEGDSISFTSPGRALIKRKD